MSLILLRALCLTNCLAQGANAVSNACSGPQVERVPTIKAYVAQWLDIDAQDITVVDVGYIPESCYTRVKLQIKGQGRPTVFYLSPDGRYLASGLLDLTLDPDRIHRNEAAEVERLFKSVPAWTTGSEDAPIEMVVFSDFQCPYCRQFAKAFESLPSEIKMQVKLSFRNYPLNIHSWARMAASYAACTGQQSPQAFWRLHQAFFNAQPSLTATEIKSIVMEVVKKETSVSFDKVQACVNTGGGDTILNRDEILAEQLQVAGTPTVFINGRRSSQPMQTSEELEIAINNGVERGRLRSKAADPPTSIPITVH